MLGDALIYAAVMIGILSLIIGWHPDGERQTQAWTAWALGQPFGRSLVGVNRADRTLRVSWARRRGLPGWDLLDIGSHTGRTFQGSRAWRRSAGCPTELEGNGYCCSRLVLRSQHLRSSTSLKRSTIAPGWRLMCRAKELPGERDDQSAETRRLDQAD